MEDWGQVPKSHKNIKTKINADEWMKMCMCNNTNVYVCEFSLNDTVDNQREKWQ